MYVLFEGIDGVGKSTQIEILAAKLSDAIVTKEPGGTKLGENLREIFRPGHADFTYFKKYGKSIIVFSYFSWSNG